MFEYRLIRKREKETEGKGMNGLQLCSCQQNTSLAASQLSYTVYVLTFPIGLNILEGRLSLLLSPKPLICAPATHFGQYCRSSRWLYSLPFFSSVTSLPCNHHFREKVQGIMIL